MKQKDNLLFTKETETHIANKENCTALLSSNVQKKDNSANEKKVSFQLQNNDRFNTDSCDEPELIEKEDDETYDQHEIGMRQKYVHGGASKVGKLINVHIDPS